MPGIHNSAAKKYKAAPKMKNAAPTNMGSAYKMKNSVLHMGAKHGTPIHANYNSPAKMPDFSGDGKITQKDVLMGRGVIPKTNESPADMGHSSPADMYGKSPAKKDKEDTKGIIGAHGDIQTGEIVYTDNKKNLNYGASMPVDPSGEGDLTIFRNDPKNMRVTVTGYKKATGNVRPGTYDATHGGHSITHHRDQTNKPSIKTSKPLENTNKKYKPS